jgi:hypothetical protein
VDWLREKMRYYRRPLCDLTEPLAAAGFVIERISEPTPSEAFKLADPEGFDRLQRVPAFLFVRARKLSAGNYGDSAFNCNLLRCIWRTIECTVTVIVVIA